MADTANQLHLYMADTANQLHIYMADTANQLPLCRADLKILMSSFHQRLDAAFRFCRTVSGAAPTAESWHLATCLG